MEIQNRLQSFPFFKNPEHQNELLENSKILSVKKGETIIREGQYLKILPLVIAGNIRVFQQYEDREALLYYVSTGQTCIMSLSSCFFNTPSKSYAVAEDDTEILCVPVKFISIWQRQYTEWNEFVLSTFRDRYDDLITSFNSAVFNNVEQRIIDYLKLFSVNHQTKSIPITHIQLAHELGTTRVVTSRILKKFEHEKKVKLLRGVIEIISL